MVKGVHCLLALFVGHAGGSSEPSDLAKDLQKIPTTTCKDNTFYIDWGSSGMKVFPVHSRNAADGTVADHKEHKLSGIGPNIDSHQLAHVLSTLKGKLPSGHIGGGVKATAGFRQRPGAAKKAWGTIRKWNTAAGLFANCTAEVDTGCQTLAGSQEARYETRGVLKQMREKQLDSRFKDRVGMVSCGGASIQLGIHGAPRDHAQRCVQHLKSLSTHYDPARAAISDSGVFFSWLANHRAPDNSSDYQIGGVNDMRSRFDTWLEKSGDGTNPCVAASTFALYKKGPTCDRLAGKGVPCLIDKWGGFMTRLNATPHSNRHLCRKSVDEFMKTDKMLTQWQTSTACQNLITGTPAWGLLSSFSRPNQLGAGTSEGKKWSKVLAQSKAVDGDWPFETPEDVKAKTVGEVLTSALLTGFLRRLGLKPEAFLEASGGDVAAGGMEDMGLAKGWVSCEGSPDAVRLEEVRGGGLRGTAADAAPHHALPRLMPLGLCGVAVAVALLVLRRARSATESDRVGTDKELLE